MKKEQTSIEARLTGSIKSIIKENSDAIKDAVHNLNEPSEVAVNFLVNRLGISENEANKIAFKFKQGFKEYDKCRAASINMEEYLSEHIKGYTDEEIREYFINVLLSLDSMDFLSENVEYSKKELEHKKKHYECCTTESLFEKVKAQLKDSNLAIKVLDLVDQIPLPGNIEKISDAFAKRKMHLRYAVAALLYIEIEEGNLDFFDGNVRLTNFQLGSIAASALDLMEVNGDFAAGKMDKAKWVSVVKEIILALIMCSLLVVLLVGTVKLMVILTGLLGGSLFVAIAVGYLIGSLAVYIIDNVAEDLTDFYNFCEKIVGKAVEIINNFYLKIKSIITNVFSYNMCEDNNEVRNSEPQINDVDADSYCIQN